MQELKWTAISGVAAIVIIVSVIFMLGSPTTNSTGAFPTGPTLADTGGVCIPNGETGCAVQGAVNCCHPAECVSRVGRVYLQQGMCKIRYSVA